jgi:hypothetical protein
MIVPLSETRQLRTAHSTGDVRHYRRSERRSSAGSVSSTRSDRTGAARGLGARTAEQLLASVREYQRDSSCSDLEEKGSKLVDEADVRMRLEDGRMQARRLKRQVQGPTLFIGVILLLAGITIFFLFYNEPLGSVGAIIVTPVALVVLLALLSTDRRLIKGVALLLACALLSNASLFARVAHQALERYRSSECEGEASSSRTADEAALLGAACSFTLVRISTAIAFSTTSSLAAARCIAMVARRRPARLVLLELWNTFGLTTLSWCGINCVSLVTAIVTRHWTADLDWFMQIGVMLELLVLGVLTLWRGFRVRAQSWLASHGEAVTTAVSIAALIGNRPVEEVQAHALQRLRCISLDQLYYAELVSPTPDAALYAKSTSAMLGDIDAFISHSWRDKPADKWAMLQRWRASFKAKHQREPRVWFDKAWCVRGYAGEAWAGAGQSGQARGGIKARSGQGHTRSRRGTHAWFCDRRVLVRAPFSLRCARALLRLAPVLPRCPRASSSCLGMRLYTRNDLAPLSSLAASSKTTSTPT